ncbi:MAG: alpha/beta hydrolase [Gemmatales bacterium]|nr:alpha/beta hydrolase [Gemmatales bacterium]MDW8221344.1 alpha/beta hydrolase [Gemmatales bacterium]
MIHRRLAWVMLAMALGLTSSGLSQDLDDLLERWGKNLLKKQFDETNVQRWQAPFERNAEIYTVRTADGWTLVAHRYRPRTPKPLAADPVILCHGLGYSALFWDLDPHCSLAEYLAQKGYDVWAVSLRGCGLSQKWVWKLDAAPTLLIGDLVRRATNNRIAPTGFATVDPKYANWTLDDHIAYDVSAFVYLVQHHTQAKNVTWIGHSMGGIIALGHLARYKNPGIARLVTVGSQMTMPPGQLPMQFFTEMLRVRERELAGKIVPEQLPQEVKTSVENMFFNENNIHPKVYQALTTWAKEVPSLGVIQQYLVLAKENELLDHKKQFNYAKALGQVQVPVLITCGAADQLAPPEVQRYLYQHLGSKQKTLLIFGKQQGFSIDAGHNDALVGLNSRKEVYPILERWVRTGKP